VPPVFIFDIGGVVIIWRNNDPLFREVAIRYHIPCHKVSAVMAASLWKLEEGKISTREYLRECLRKVGRRLPPKEDVARLWQIPFERGAKGRKGVIEIVKRLKKDGHSVCAFSNTSAPHVPVMRKLGWTTPLFDQFFASCYIKDVKPRRSAFSKVLAKIGARPEDVVFIDNTAKHVQGAKNAGIKHAIHFHSIKTLRKEIRIILSDYYSKEKARKTK
jgi:HAD superfamily hydrolase (TIGR01509 family)